jgi:hypothetical protein
MNNQGSKSVLEVEVQRNYDIQKALNEILRIMLKDIPLKEMWNR